MATNSSSRDARRRRIAERGSDRLALITGRLDSLPSSKSFSDLPPTVVPQNEDKHSSSFSHDFSNDPSQHDKYGGRTGIEQHSVQSDSSSQESRPSALDTDEKIKQSPVSSKIEGSPISTSNVEHHSANIEPVIHRRFNSISPRQITVAVAASEMIRIYCSLAAAILVFLSYIGFPILGNSIIKSVILSRPLYLLLVTNISVVLVPLFLDKQRQVNSCAEASGASPLGAFQFGKALEVQANRSTRLQRILEEKKEADGEAEIRERMHMLVSQVIDSISNLHEVFTSPIFIVTSRGFWDRMGQIVLKFLEVRKENRVWYRGSYYALRILDNTFASQMQRLQMNALQDKDTETPHSICPICIALLHI